MTIASEITDLNTNLTAAKNAVTAKGGTIGDTGLAGLADEIATIPTGGGTLENYGTLKYLDSNDVEQTVVIATEVDFEELTLGDSTSTLTINNTQVPKAKITEVEIADGVVYLPNLFLYGCTALTKLTLPDSIQYMGDRFIQECTSFNSTLNFKNLKRVGQYFMYGCTSYNQTTSFPAIEYIDAYFMNNCTAFNSSLTLNDDCLKINQRFLNGCGAFAQSFTIPSGLITTLVTTNPDNYFMFNCTSFTGPLVCNGPSDSSKIATGNQMLANNQGASLPMYATGITLTGTYASAWKNALPDRDSSPYRKLILGS